MDGMTIVFFSLCGFVLLFAILVNHISKLEDQVKALKKKKTKK